MQAGNVPIKFTYAWGAQASSSYITTPIPAATQTGPNAGRASQQIGFPPETFVDPAAGGIWPDGRDAQGALNMVSQWSIWFQGGGPIQWDATFSANQGGYAKGAVVQSNTSFGVFWLSTQDSNTTNPDASGAGWVSLFAGRLLKITPLLASTVFTPSPFTNSIIFEGCGGGSGSGGTTATGAGEVALSYGGFSGAYFKVLVSSGFASGVAITIGTAGAAAAPGGLGGVGGPTLVGAFVTAPGGPSAPAGGANTIPSNTFGLEAPAAYPTLSAGVVDLGCAIGFRPGPGVWANQIGGGPPVISYGAQSFFGPSGMPGSGGDGIYAGQNLSPLGGYPGYSGRVNVYEYS